MRKSRVVIQARLSSTRLPGKVVLPLKGIPVVVLCARRAANRGASVVVAISDEPSDDALANILSENALITVRGSLDNVLERFVKATSDLAEHDLVIRLTADNVLPDGDFLERMTEEFDCSESDYLGTNSPFDGLPYGLSAEIFTAGILRKAHKSAKANDEREHVTPWIRRQARSRFVGNSLFGLEARFDHLRCTLDSMDDYVRLARLFDALHVNPVDVEWRQLVNMLADSPGSARFRIPYRPDSQGKPQGVLSLGTAQLGMQYGAANRTGQPSIAETARIVHAAIDHGVTFIDTARAYGNAENRIGDILRKGDRERIKIISKLDPLNGLGDSESAEQIVRAVDASVFRSCRELRCNTLDVLMLHRWSHRHRFRELIWQRLLNLKKDGVIGELGASVSSPAEAIEALRDSDIRHIQLPYNLLDWRWNADSFLMEIKNNPGISIHSRSAYLQGILIASESAWPNGMANPQEWIDRMNEVVAILGRESRADLCLAFVLGTPWLTSVVVGAETERQMMDNFRLSLRPALNAEQHEYVRKTLAGAPEKLLDPAMW